MKAKSFRYSKLVRAILLTMVSYGASCLATAADFDARVASEKRSATVGLGRDSIDLLRRENGPGVDKVAADLLSRFDSKVANKGNAVYTSDHFKKTVTDKQTTYIGEEGWNLQVYGDGSNARYRNYRHIADIPDLQRSVAKRFSNEELENMGRDFIAGELTGLITLGPNEEIVPYFTQFEVTGGGSTEKDSAMDQEMVHASTVVFTRVVDGLPVVGGGSKVAVIFANDGKAIGFDFDWPSYESNRKHQQVLKLDQIKERGREYSTHEFNSAEVRELHFDCGYVDFGARKRDHKAPVQAGCMRQSAKKQIVDAAVYQQDQRSGHIVDARLDYLPAGETMEVDAFWSKGKRRAVEKPAELKP